MSSSNASWESFDVHFLPKNFSYEENYHKKFYYPKIVYERIKQRLSMRPSLTNGSTGSLSALSSCSSLPDLSEALLAADQTDNATIHHVDSSENLSRCTPRSKHRHRVPFSLGESHDEDDNTSVASRTTSEGDDVSSTSGESAIIASHIAANISVMDNMDEQELWDLVRPPPRRRSSSLRRSKSPASGDGDGTVSPGCEHRKKVVRFADVMGLDLRSVRRIRNKDLPPVMPAAALRDLRPGLEEAHKAEGTRYVCACFTQPGDQSNFLERVMKENVALERCFIGERDRTITGVVRVANLCFRKQVTIRYSVNRWVTFDDITASYVLDSNDGTTDRFSFSVNLPKCLSVGAQLQLAVRYEAIDVGCSFWDNNYDDNYCFECFARAVPTRESDFAWMHFL